LTAFLLFSSFASNATIGRTEIMVQGIPTIANERRLGFPFEMMTLPVGSLDAQPTTTLPGILWQGVLMNILMFFLISFGITYLTAKAWHTYKTRRLETIEISSENDS